MPAKVVVVGSLNMDLVTRASRLPRAGETLIGQTFSTVPGGKGANQAVASARLGADVSMIGCVGTDAYGTQLRDALQVEGIDCQAVSTVDGSSGVALIVVDDSSQNAIVIVAGSNGELTPASLQAFDAVLQAADVIVCQLEVPMKTVGYALKRGRELGKTVILNPAPASAPLPAEWYASIDYLIPNESEATALSGVTVDSIDSAKAAATHLIQAGAGKVIITLGAQGALFTDGQGFEHLLAPKVKAVDTTAAGDTFVGGFAAALANGKSEAEAIRFGQVAAALSVTRAGAQPSIPTLHDVQGFVPS
ncbi:ribokinase [Pseudomonas fluorescens group sp.]|uniref:Ribokinase n=2 Tax=Pseudomonas fluorescens TaxID=294 RepID=C3JZP5_PSEFS|nr:MULTISPECIES: ribokinase [Pseudomonas fluorescens group]MBZ6456663.1 ribokinase [Pseudomonas fluorescens group sp.]MBZ6462610.1 ribokinase [Pseudomonas fluorescens group sp.]MBZ6468751.1 ribokinase [Pseudomonas fluorescens group sp.]WQD70487.1 ribokinase [Pseudomonas marginalis]CAI2798350.1 Ribokinase (RK) (EC [Pseudomonas fluorescens SBW25]